MCFTCTLGNFKRFSCLVLFSSSLIRDSVPQFFFSTLVPFSFIMNLFSVSYVVKGLVSHRLKVEYLEILKVKYPDQTVSHPTYFCVALNLLIRGKKL